MRTLCGTPCGTLYGTTCGTVQHVTGPAGKRELILNAAVGLAHTEGLSGLSVRSVAAAAGIGATTLRSYFPSQAQLHRAVAERMVTASLTDEPLRDRSRPAVDRLEACLVQFLPGTIDERGLQSWFALLALALGPEADAGVRELMRTGNAESAAVVARWLGVLAEDGVAVRGEPALLAARFTSLVSGLHLMVLLEGTPAALEQARETVRWYAEQCLAHSQATSDS
jgi:AcrR family transcriptional regulator